MTGAKPRLAWQGLGLWNLYFFSKFFLYYAGYLDLKLLPNLAFAAALLVPMPGRWLNRLRTLLAVPVAAALYYQDTWFPPISRLAEREGVLNFSADYVLELLGRFIDWRLCAALLALAVGYALIRHWLRLTTFTLAGLAVLLTAHVNARAPSAVPQASVPTSAAQAVVATDEVLDGYLAQFYRTEVERQVQFAPLPELAKPFDILLINVCSLAWSDLQAIGLKNNPFFEQMDVVFENFNSATSYSGPAAVRLLRASCGQGSHTSLYSQAPKQCLLLENLHALGYEKDILMTHDGKFEGYLDRVREQGVTGPSLNTGALPTVIRGFDGTPIKRDLHILDLWWQNRSQQSHARSVLFYNTTTLHDGNRIVTADGKVRPASFAERANNLFADLQQFIQHIENSDRAMLLVFVPEHGVGLSGDRLQISGMRELPSADLTHVPVAVKAINFGPSSKGPVYLKAPSSYLAISELISRITQLTEQPQGLDWDSLLADLPQTPNVSENQGSVVLDYQGTSYIRMKEQQGWMPYPTRSP